MSEEPEGPHTDFCPMRRTKSWRDLRDRFATCHCSNAVLGRMLRKA